MNPTKLLPEWHVQSLMSEGWFAALPKGVRDEVISHGYTRIVADGDRIFTAGEVTDSLYVVLEGCAKVSGTSKHGRETVLDFYGPGKWFGEVAAIDGLPRIHSAQAVGRTVLLKITTDNLSKLLHKQPVFCRALLRLEATRLRIVLTALEQYSTQSLEHRLANRLLMLMSSFGKPDTNGIRIDLHLSQEMLAQLIGATRQRINQILREWERSKILRQKYGTITILNRQRLEQVAE